MTYNKKFPKNIIIQISLILLLITLPNIAVLIMYSKEVSVYMGVVTKIDNITGSIRQTNLILIYIDGFDNNKYTANLNNNKNDIIIGDTVMYRKLYNGGGAKILYKQNIKIGNYWRIWDILSIFIFTIAIVSLISFRIKK